MASKIEKSRLSQPHAVMIKSTEKARDSYDGKVKDIYKKPYQLFHNPSKRGFVYFNQNPAVSSSVLAGSSEVQSDMVIEKDKADLIKGISLRETLTETGGSAAVSPGLSNYSCNRIEYVGNGGQQHLMTIYHDNIIIDASLLLNEEDWEQVILAMGSTSTFGTVVSMAASAVRYDYIPLYNHPLVLCNVHLNKLRNDFINRIYFRHNESTGSGVLGVSLDALIEEEKLSEMDKLISTKLHENTVREFIMLEPMRYISGAITVTASTEKILYLDSIKGKCAFMVFALRAGEASASDACTTFAGLGDDATIDLKSSTNQSYISTTPMKQKELQHIFHRNTNLFKAKDIYLLPFCHDIKKAYHGDMSGGYHEFDGTKQSLNLTPNASWSTGTFYVSVYCYVFKKMRLCNGRWLQPEYM